jgi:hypothetical protein
MRQTFWPQYAWFSLTPAVSPEERETRIPFLDKPERLELIDTLTTILPLPKGEGERRVPLIQRALLQSDGFEAFIIASPGFAR